jgi:SOS-response transcriptional repressor LexA
VVIESRQARAGEIVVALIDGLSTLKRLVRGGDGLPYLKSENKDYPELRPMSELIVQGVASSVVRRL